MQQVLNIFLILTLQKVDKIDRTVNIPTDIIILSNFVELN